MTRTDRPVRSAPRRTVLRTVVATLAVLLIAPATLAACSSTGGSSDQMATAMPTMAATAPGDVATAAPSAATDPGVAADPRMVGTGADLMPADASEAWASRPDFTRVDPQTEEAYAYALYHPQVVQWMPCYCGCARMGHRSNLDCYLKRAVPGQKTQFEEHASYCEVCVKITMLTKQMVSQGKSLREIRQSVDQTYGGNALGTPTEQPPA